MSLKRAARLALAGAVLAAALPVAAQQQRGADDIVVTARRSGIPIWRVTSDTTAVVLVGAIQGVPRETRWDPTALTEAMRKADRIMFPQMQSVTASPLAYPGLLMRWRRHATLPEGQSLFAMLDPLQRARLAELQRRGLVGADADRKHPLHLGLVLRGRVFGRDGRDAYDEARRAISKYRLNLVPVATRKAGPVANQLFGSSPESHLPCLVSAIDLAEAGPDAVRARAEAWAGRRTRAAIDNAAERAQHSCWPNNPARFAAHDAELVARIRELLGEPQVTLAILSLRSLARSGGILDTLERSGFDIQGPDWRN